jgi:hypothetical protein
MRKLQSAAVAPPPGAASTPPHRRGRMSDAIAANSALGRRRWLVLGVLRSSDSKIYNLDPATSRAALAPVCRVMAWLIVVSSWSVRSSRLLART